jgi:hypothetical protein
MQWSLLSCLNRYSSQSTASELLPISVAIDNGQKIREENETKLERR